MSLFNNIPLTILLTVNVLFAINSVNSTSVGVKSSSILVEDYYRDSCPIMEDIVREHVKITLYQDVTMAASLLRLLFHDCFVMGCDASVLLDSNGGIASEKDAQPNANSIRGFDVIDKIKYSLEYVCPQIVSCADILATVARQSVVLRGGPTWPLLLGRRDSLTASISGANRNIPAPNLSLSELIQSFQVQGLDKVDLVSLSGSHTIGRARCVSFRKRLYEDDPEYYSRYSMEDYVFKGILESSCPRQGNDNLRLPLDFLTSTRFDNEYYRNLVQGRGLLASDNVLVSQHADDDIAHLVWTYAMDQSLFFKQFAESMVNMGNIHPLTGEDGEIRLNCRYTNSYYGAYAQELQHGRKQ